VNRIAMGRAPRRGGALRRIVVWSAIAAVLTAGLVGVILYRELTRDLPPVEQLANYRPPVATRIFAEDGTLIGELAVERRYLVPLDQVPPPVRNAFLAAEDAHFYQHHGIDPVGIARALLVNLTRHTVAQGGSTITQQVVKALLLTPERSYERKLKELVLALRLEAKLTKDEILYLYLNQIYFGSGAYGVAAAARVFFDVDVADLTIAQAAFLAGLPQAPSRYDPHLRPKAATARQHYVLKRMRDSGFITPAEHDAALAEPLEFAARRPGTYLAAPWYVEHVRRLLEERYGGTATAQLGLRVHTAVNLDLQRAAEEALRDGIRDIERRQGYRGPIRHLEAKKLDAYLVREREMGAPEGPTRRGVVLSVKPGGLVVRTAWETGVLPTEALVWGRARVSPSSFSSGDVIAVALGSPGADGVARFTLDQEPQVEGALVCFDPYTGEVKAMVGGYDFRRSVFNRAVQAHRQPGSSFKPLIYASAIDHGYTPASIVLDAPIEFTFANQTWAPKNFKNQYYGPTALRMALARSLNTVTVRLVDAMGIEYVREYLSRFDLHAPLPPNLSLALGSAEVTPLDLTRAYGVFATLGKRFDPIFITAITDNNDTPLEFGHTRPHFEPVMRAATAYVVTSMMQTVVQRGTGKKALELGRPVAGKTGTTNDTHDAWFVGFTPDLLAGVWVGFDAERSLGKDETGGHAAAPIWTAFMKKAMEGRPVVDFPVPDGITFAQVDPATGLRAVPGGESELEVFVRGSEPTQYATPAQQPDENDEQQVQPTSGAAPSATDND
jgi:penicillin-binding protein 1A